MKVNTLEISPYGPRYNQDFEYIATYKKGKNSKVHPDNFRILVRGCLDNKEYIIWFEIRERFMGRVGKIYMHLHALDKFKHISPTEIKNLDNKRYNYHKVRVDSSDMNLLLDEWKNTDPLVIVGQYTHQHISKINNYTWTYKFNGKKY